MDALHHLLAHGWVFQEFAALLDGGVDDVAPTGQQVQRAVAPEAHIHGDRHGHRQCDCPPAHGAGQSRWRHLAFNPLGIAGIDHEEVPVERATRRSRQLGQQLGLVRFETGTDTREDAGQEGTRVAAGHGTKGEQFVVVRASRWYGPTLSITVVVGGVE